MEAIKKSNSSLPFYAVIQSTNNDSMEEFLVKSNISFPYITTPDLTAMVKVAGSDYPIILYLNEGYIEKSLTMYDLNKSDMEQWLLK
ncbi:MAG: hypothetical protein ACK4WD_04135 [Flavobacteriales bacterium]|jgi:hypothetical protein